VQGGLGGHVYAAGVTADFSWWPTFLPMKPASELEVSAFATDELDYGVEMAGQYAFEFPDGVHGMAGSFSIENERNTWSGHVLSGGDTWGVGGEATKDMSTLYLTPPQALLDALTPDVNDRILPRIEEAEAAWEDLQAATGDYEFELSLRGLRTQLPGIVDDAKAKALERHLQRAREPRGGDLRRWPREPPPRRGRRVLHGARQPEGAGAGGDRQRPDPDSHRGRAARRGVPEDLHHDVPSLHLQPVRARRRWRR